MVNTFSPSLFFLSFSFYSNVQRNKKSFSSWGRKKWEAKIRSFFISLPLLLFLSHSNVSFQKYHRPRHRLRTEFSLSLSLSFPLSLSVYFSWWWWRYSLTHKGNKKNEREWREGRKKNQKVTSRQSGSKEEEEEEVIFQRDWFDEWWGRNTPKKEQTILERMMMKKERRERERKEKLIGIIIFTFRSNVMRFYDLVMEWKKQWSESSERKRKKK